MARARGWSVSASPHPCTGTTALAHDARVLEERARELAREAPSLPPAAIEERVAGLDAACAGCHARLGLAY